MDWRVRSIIQILILGCLSALVECGAAEQRVVCYYTNWSVYRPGTAKFSPQNINPYLCTHLVYAFGGFTKDNALKPFDKYQDIEKGGYAKFTGLKTYNKNLKTMLAIGGWNEGSTRFSPMVADPERRKEFVRNSVKFLRQNHFDGLDLDWEYPAFRDGGKPRDRDNYASLVQELREAYERESSKTGRPRLLLSMAVPAGIEYIDKGYDIPKLNKYLDFINLLSYDYHSSYEPAVNHHSPLYPLEEDNEYNFDTELTVDYTIKHLLKSGASADKIVLGIPTYGRSYTLFNEEATEIGSPADGPGEEGDATREKGYLAYYEICEGLIDSEEWEVVSPNPNAMGPYAYKGKQWVGYDDESIVRLKAKYVSENGLGGIMFWSIDNDDFRGKCHNRPYPLIEAAKEAMLAGTEKTGGKEKSTRPTKTRQPVDSNFISRKLGAGRRRTTETPAVVRQESSRQRPSSLRNKNRSNAKDNTDEEESQVPHNGRNRGQFSLDSEDDEDANENSKIGSNVLRRVTENSDENDEETPTPQSGNRARNNQGKRRKSGNNRRRTTTTSSISEPVTAQAGNSRITTPEPPTTPDPGTDFKCEDEGFFSHPRDCKKYFWCLDAGPGGLGIVAHHFTCPAGLVFNKGADSCDYPRNVVCPKAKPAEAPTTQAPIIAATSRTTRIQSTTRRPASTTPEPSESGEEYEYYDDEDEDDTPVTTTTAKTLLYKSISRNRPTSTTTAAPTTITNKPRSATSRTYQSVPSRSRDTAAAIEEAEEEDPKVIQELIELIKKAGGIEELEKQLHLQGKGSESASKTGTAKDKADVTPANITRSLYERVLNRKANGRTTLFPRTTVAPIITVTTEPAERLDTQASVSQGSKPSFRNGPGGAQFEGLDDIPEVKSLRREKPQYVTINRQRPSTQAPDETGEEIESDNSDEASSQKKLIADPTEATSSTSQRQTSGYVDIRRTRTSTARSDDLKDEDDRDSFKSDRHPATLETESEEEDLAPRQNRFPNQEETTASTTSRYINIQRMRFTTQASEETSLEKEEERQIIETTTKSADSPDVITTTISSHDNVPVTETTAADEPESRVTSTPQFTNFVSADPQNVDTLTTLSPITVKLVEETSTTTTLPVVSSTERQENISGDTVTKGSVAVSQPRPFGFQRRTRPTTTSSTITSSPESTTSSVNTETGRVKVPSETVRLPTLKEIIGHKTNVIPHDYTTTTPITLSIKNLNDENDINPTEYNKHGQTVTPDILTEEVTSTQATAITVQDTTLETTENNDYAINRVEDDRILLSGKPTSTESPRSRATLPIKILKQDEISPKRRKIKLVNIPVRILESDKPLTDVILEVPEHKLNSVLRSLLRVEIINQDNETNSYGEQSKDENNNSQRRYSIEEEPNELLSKDANTNSVLSESQFTSTTPSVSTVRGSRPGTLRHIKSRNRGFYVTKSIESNTVYETVTPPTTLQSTTESDNELIQRFSTTTEQLSTVDDASAHSTTGGVTTTTSDYTAQAESASEITWPSTIRTTIENFNDILAFNEDVVKSTVTADYSTSTESLSTTTETFDNVKPTTEPGFTESEGNLYTSQFEEQFESFSTQESSSTDSEIMFESDQNYGLSTTTFAPGTISEGLDDHDTAIDTVTPAGIQESTILEQSTDSVSESSTLSSETTRLSTGFNLIDETSDISDFQKTTAFDFEGTSESTELFSTETRTISPETTAVTYNDDTGFSNEVNPSRETISTESTTDLGKSTAFDSKSTTVTTDQSVDSYSVSQTEDTNSTPVTITSSVSNPDSQTTTVPSLNTETSSPSTEITISDSSTTSFLYTAIADETETYSYTTNEVGSTNMEIKSTTSGTEPTTGLESTVTISTLAIQQSKFPDANFDYSTEIDTQTVSTLATSASESTIFPSTTEKKEEPVNEVETAQQGTLQSPTQAPMPFTVPTEPTDLEFPRQSSYRSPTAIPGRKTKHKRIVKKRIYGVRRPHVEAINGSETATNVTPLDTSKKPRQRFIRRRIINRTTGKIEDVMLKANSTVLRNRNKTIYSSPDFIKNKVNNERQESELKSLPKRRTIYRRRPVAADNQTNSSIEANISSQTTNRASNNDHVQSSNVSSTNQPNQRRRIVVQRFRYRNSGVDKSTTTLSPSPSASESPNTESTVEDKVLLPREDKRKTIGQIYRDVTIDNLSSGSESHQSEEELPPRRALQTKSEDEQAGEINLFKTRPSNLRRPGFPIRQNRPSSSTLAPENEIPTTVSSSTKTPNNLAIRRRFRLGQRPTTPASNAGAHSQPSDGDTLKSGAEDVSGGFDQAGYAQEVEIAVTAGDSSSPAPPVQVTGRRPAFRTSVRRRPIFTTEVPQATVSTTPRPTIVRQRQRPNPFDKIVETAPARPRRPAIIDYDYYEDSEERVVGKSKLSGKISFTAGGSIRCLDQGNFPHPSSCKKFITCARMVNGQVIGTEYTCPKRLSFDPVGGICNWSAGLGCKE